MPPIDLEPAEIATSGGKDGQIGLGRYPHGLENPAEIQTTAESLAAPPSCSCDPAGEAPNRPT